MTAVCLLRHDHGRRNSAIWGGIGLVMAAILYEPAFAVITTWFARARHQALAVLTVVAGFASVVFTPLAGWLVEVQGWRGALVTLAGILGVLTILPHALVLRRRPEDLGLRPDGAAADPPAPGTAATLVAAGPSPSGNTRTQSVPGRVALRDPSFWWLTAALFLATLAVTAISVHLVAYLREDGYGASFAATWTGLIGAGSVLGRVAVTAAGRRLALPLVTAATFALQALAVLVLLGWDQPAGGRHSWCCSGSASVWSPSPGQPWSPTSTAGPTTPPSAGYSRCC